MSETEKKLAELKATAEGQLKECGVSKVDNDRLDELVGRMRTMVNNRDAVLVSTGDESELETVRRNFVVKKLGVDDKEKGMKAVQAVGEKMSGIRMKSRAAFYYLLQDQLK